MGVPPNIERTVNMGLGAVFGNRLGYRNDMGFIEGCFQTGAAMSGCTESNSLLRYSSIRNKVIV